MPDGTKALKLGDFGLATEAHSLLYTVCGTPTYVAPEVLGEVGYVGHLSNRLNLQTRLELDY